MAKDDVMGLQLELDSEGRPAGVEFEDVDAGVEIREPFDPRLIDVTTETRSLDTLIRRIEAGQIDLDPDFQRSRGIWTDAKKSLLVESLLLRIPLPTFYVAEVEGGMDLGEERWAVVDGIQRLSTVVEFMDPDVLGYQPLQLKGLEYLKSEEGKTFAELPPALRLRLLESQFTIQVIRKSTPEPVQLNIFARINTGGVPLSAQELRHALIPGPARSVLRAMSESKAFQRAVAHSVSPTRMVDREMALRFLAFRSVDPTSYREPDFDRFLRQSMRAINEATDDQREEAVREFEWVMDGCSAIFGDDAFRKRYNPDDQRRPVSKALFESISVGIATIVDRHGESGLETLMDNAVDVRQEFVGLMNDREFDRAISQGTGDPVRVRIRFERIAAMFDEIVERWS